MGKITDKIVKTALKKGKTLDERYSWTIHFLIDLKIVYIITYAYITIVNLISSTANSEATSDANGMSLFNVTLSPEHRNVGVDSISDAVLWNCRRQSVTNRYYRFLYWALFIALIAALVGFLVTKFIVLITVCCNRGSFNKYGLTKLWHIAILKQLKNPTKPLKLALKDYQPLLDEGIPKDLELPTRESKCKNCCRLAIPGFLLCFCVLILGLSYLSYDLHPLACVSQPEEARISYNSTTKRVELEFSDELANFQKAMGVVVIILVIMYLILAYRFYLLSKEVIRDLKTEAGNAIDQAKPRAKPAQAARPAAAEVTPVTRETTL